MTAVRLVVGALGLAAVGYGALRLLDLGWANLIATVLWLAGGVLLHDAVLAPVTVAVGAAGARALPRRARAAAAGGFVVLGTVTLMAVPVLGRFGARPDNPTLLDRPYGWGWVAVAGLVALGVLGAAVLAQPRRQDSDGGRLGAGDSGDPGTAGPPDGSQGRG